MIASKIDRITIDCDAAAAVVVVQWWYGGEPEPEGEKVFRSILAAALWVAEQEGYRP